MSWRSDTSSVEKKRVSLKKTTHLLFFLKNRVLWVFFEKKKDFVLILRKPEKNLNCFY